MKVAAGLFQGALSREPSSMLGDEHDSKRGDQITPQGLGPSLSSFESLAI